MKSIILNKEQFLKLNESFNLRQAFTDTAKEIADTGGDPQKTPISVLIGPDGQPLKNNVNKIKNNNIANIKIEDENDFNRVKDTMQQTDLDAANVILFKDKANPNTIPVSADPENESKIYTKKEIDEARIKTLNENSFKLSKGELIKILNS